MREPPDYKAIEREIWQENEKEVVPRLKKREKFLMQRIEIFLWQFPFLTRENVYREIETNRLFAVHFSIEPRRQGFHQNVAQRLIKTMEHVQDFKKLPASGEKALYVSGDGMIIGGLKHKPSKSLDFYWKTGDTEFYAAHKFTKQSGGDQDNQFREMRTLLESYIRTPETHKVLLVIVDGLYYTDERMADLRRFARSPVSHACHIQNVPDVLLGYVEQA